jgi:hypothetical protein
MSKRPAIEIFQLNVLKKVLSDHGAGSTHIVDVHQCRRQVLFPAKISGASTNEEIDGRTERHLHRLKIR